MVRRNNRQQQQRQRATHSQAFAHPLCAKQTVAPNTWDIAKAILQPPAMAPIMINTVGNNRDAIVTLRKWTVQQNADLKEIQHSYCLHFTRWSFLEKFELFLKKLTLILKILPFLEGYGNFSSLLIEEWDNLFTIGDGRSRMRGIWVVAGSKTHSMLYFRLI